MQTKSKILAVDDNPTNIAVMEEILETTYTLETCRSGEEALIRAPLFRPDIVLLDVMMPGINGYDVCRALRAEPTLRHTKIIIVSAKALVSERLKGYESGADDYLTKPFEEEELLAKVRVYLRLKKVEEVDQLKSDVLALLGHETRTPLNGILAPAEMLMAKEPMEVEERIALAQMIHQSGTQLHAYLEKIMTLSALRSGRLAFRFQAHDLGEQVRAAAEAVAPRAAERNVTVDLHLDEAVSPVMDPTHLRMVLVALLDNAVRFSPAGARVQVTMARDADRVLLHVRDEGPGIDPDALPRIFEDFAEMDVTLHAEGHGLSLAVARGIVQEHGGEISASSRRNVETVFTVALPLAGPATASAAHEHAAASATF